MPQSHSSFPAALHRLGLSHDVFRANADRLMEVDRPRLARLWSYYRNPMRAAAADGASTGPYQQAQEYGLPRRIVGDPSAATPRREVVIENDIAWRLDVMVDFLFGKPIALSSTASDESRRGVIQALLHAVIAQNGGLVFFQQLAVLGAVYGYVDVLVKLLPEDAAVEVAVDRITTNASAAEAADPAAHRQSLKHFEQREDSEPSVVLKPNADIAHEPVSSDDPSHESGATTPSLEAITRLARRIRLEVVEPTRAVPVLRDGDARIIEAYAQVYEINRPRNRANEAPAATPREWFRRAINRITSSNAGRDDTVTVVDVVTPEAWLTAHDETVVAAGRNTLGQLPLVHVQNVAAPFSYAGGSDVEPLLPLQDEINTRLSDRAHRITMQSFRMYLGKGIDNFLDQPVAPGRMWMSENPEAQIIEFGGDAACPSEEAHLRDLREAMDKISGVSPIAAGALHGRIGRLTSAAALRVTMMALLARTERKRATYGAGIRRMCELALAWLDHAGLFKTTPDERQVDIAWPDPLPIIDDASPAIVRTAGATPRDEAPNPLRIS